jgi:hypothetical protein
MLFLDKKRMENEKKAVRTLCLRFARPLTTEVRECKDIDKHKMKFLILVDF